MKDIDAFEAGYRNGYKAAHKELSGKIEQSRGELGMEGHR